MCFGSGFASFKAVSGVRAAGASPVHVGRLVLPLADGGRDDRVCLASNPGTCPESILPRPARDLRARTAPTRDRPGLEPPEPQVRVQTLDNGLRVATARMPGFRTASVGAWLRAGSRDESAPLNGLTHFFEHMAFKGTARRGARDITFAIERVGGSINAYTAKDHTAYETEMLAGQTDAGARCAGRRPAALHFPQDEIERERQVILQELADAADDPDSMRPGCLRPARLSAAGAGPTDPGQRAQHPPDLPRRSGRVPG
jgi:hypothetical protein